MLSCLDLLDWQELRSPDTVALVDDRGDQATYAELAERSRRAAAGWHQAGVRRGEVVAILERNSVAFFVQLFGLARLCAVPALVNWRLSATEIAALYEVCSPVAAAVGPGMEDQLPDTSGPVFALANGGPDGEPELITGFDRPTSTDPFALCFSSGTTGLPKAVPMAHGALARTSVVDPIDINGMRPGAIHLIAAPAFHLAGLSNTLMGLAHGATVHTRAAFDAGCMLDDIERLAVNYITAVPAMFLMLVNEAATRATLPDVSSLEEASYGASPIAPEVLAKVMALFPGTRLRQFYGMTELCGVLSMLPPEDHVIGSDKLGSAGRASPWVQVRLVDRDGTDVVDGEPGEILVRGEGMMTAYWNNPEATAAAFSDGWFHTGDVAVRRDGYLTIMDRAKDMVISGGENVYPAEVEAMLFEFEGIIDAAIIGIPHQTMGEQVHAVIVGDVDKTALSAWCRQRMAGFKCPRSFEFVDALPRNATGKVLKKDLRAPYWEGRSRSVN